MWLTNLYTKTRIAPTPSGYLHLGNVLSFAITVTLARKHGAKILLRIDDLDRARGEVVGVDREQLVRADEREGDERDAGLDGHKGAAGEEGVRLAVGGTASFGEDEER